MICRYLEILDQQSVRQVQITPEQVTEALSNLVFPERYAESTYASVFIDAEQNPDEPYEMYVYHQPERQRKWKTAEELETIPGFDKPGRGLFRYRSKDGKA